MLGAADFHFRPTRQIAIAGRADSDQTRQLLKIIHGQFIPNKILVLAPPDPAALEAAAERIPLVKDKRMLSETTTVYVCENSTCKRPLSDAADLRQLLDGVR